MIDIYTQSIEDTAGEKLVVLPQSVFDKIIDELEEFEDIKLYDEAKKNDTGETIPMDQAFRMIEEKRIKKS